MAGVFGLGVTWAALCVGAVGLPLGVPPQAETPLLAKVAPDNCLFYMSSAGLATPDASSSNQTEQLLAEPEAQRFLTEIARASSQEIAEALNRPNRPGVEHLFTADELTTIFRVVLSQPAAVFVSGVSLDLEGVVVRAGAVVKVGDEAEQLRTMVENATRRVLGGRLQNVDVEGVKCQSFQIAPNAKLVWGFKGKYFLLSVGEEELKAMFKRARGPAPQWMTQLREELPVERVSTVTYVNLKTLLQFPAAFGGQNANLAIQSLGLGNVMALRMVTGLDKECYVTKTQLTIDGEPQGIFSLAAGKPLDEADLASIPRYADFVMAARVDLAGAYSSFLSTMEKIDPTTKNGIVAGLSGLEQGIGVKLQDDVLQPLGDLWIVSTMPGRTPQGPPNVLLRIALKDPVVFTAAYNKVMPMLLQNPWKQQPGGQNGPTLGKVVGPRDVYTLMAPVGPTQVPLSWCVTDKELLFGLTPQSLFDYAPQQSSETLAQLAEVAAMLKADPGPLALAYMNIPKFFDEMTPVLPGLAQSGLSQSFTEFDATTIPSAATIKKHLRPCVTSVRRTAAGIEVTETAPIPGIGFTQNLPFAVGLLMPAIQAARAAARRAAAQPPQ